MHAEQRAQQAIGGVSSHQMLAPYSEIARLKLDPTARGCGERARAVPRSRVEG
jgi:hypothetical protein